VYENRGLRRISGLEREEVTEDGKNCIMWSFVTCKNH
jgi:hypothetical protein